MQERDSTAREDGSTDSPATTNSEQTSATSTMEQARDKAIDTADGAKDKAAGGMESAADTVREKLGDTGVSGAAGTKLADGMEKTAGYLRDHDTQQIMEDLDRYVKEHPTQALIGAVAVGFVIGRMVR